VIYFIPLPYCSVVVYLKLKKNVIHIFYVRIQSWNFVMLVIAHPLRSIYSIPLSYCSVVVYLMLKKNIINIFYSIASLVVYLCNVPLSLTRTLEDLVV
jgi:hypothetical protein